MDIHNVKKIYLVGDIMLGRDVFFRSDETYDPFIDIRKCISQNAVVIGNFETVLTTGQIEYTDNTKKLAAHPDILKKLNVPAPMIISLANNHLLDYGSSVAKETIQHVGERFPIMGIGTSQNEAGAPILLSLSSGKKVGVLAYQSGNYENEDIHLNHASQKALTDQIATLKKTVDFIIVSVHWGQEYVTSPTSDQISKAHKMIDLGANIVFGHHPHVLQGSEEYKDGLIFYSLGNCIFDTRSSNPKTRDSAMIEVDLEKEISFTPHFFSIDDRYIPRKLNDQEQNKKANEFKSLSSNIVKQSSSADEVMIRNSYRQFLSNPKMLWRHRREIKPKYFLSLIKIIFCKILRKNS